MNEITVHRGSRTAAELARLLDAHARALGEGRGVLKDDHRSAVTRVRADDGEALCVKQYRLRRRGGARRLLRASRGARAWRAAEQLASLGVATPEPVALVERHGETFLVTRFVADSLPLDRLERERLSAKSADEIARKRSLLRALGRWAGRLHALGVYHGDLSAKNVLAVESDEGHAFHLLDLDGLTPRGRLTYRRRVKNLAQLLDPSWNTTRSDCLRVLAGYAESAPPVEWRRLARDVDAAMLRRSTRRARVMGRPGATGYEREPGATSGTPVLHLLSNWRWTGPSEPAVNLAVALHGPDWDVRFACGREPRGFEEGPSSVRRKALERGLPTREGLWLRKHAALMPTWKDARAVRVWLDKDAFEIVHCHQRNAHLVAALAARGRARRPLLVRTCYAADGPEGFRERRLLSKHTDALLLVSERARHRVVNELGFPSERATVLEGAVDLQRFDPGRVAGDRRDDLGIARDAFVVGIVARIQWRRRFHIFLEAVDRARRQVPGLRVVIIGRGTNMKAIAVDPVQKMGLGDVVVFPGYQTGDDYVRTLACMDVAVYLVPGTDGSCRAAREALALGIPVIAPELGPLPELIGDDERGLVMDGSVADLTRCIVALAEDRERLLQMSQCARDFAREHFSLERQAEQVGRLYRELLDVSV